MKPSNKSQHTQGEAEVIEGKGIFTIRAKGSNEVIVYKVNATTMNPVRNKANAERIVKAINLHDELIKRIQILHNALKQSAEGYFDTDACRETNLLLKQVE